MEYLNTRGSGAYAPSSNKTVVKPPKVCARRYGANSKNRSREPKLFDGELPEDQRWINGLEGKYAITTEGIPLRYFASGKTRQLTVTIHRGHPHVRIFLNDEPKWFNIAREIARSFLGSDRYILKDGNPLHATLNNIVLIHSPMQPEERWIAGFEQQYSVTPQGDVFSYKCGRRRELKTSKSLSKSRRVCLTRGSEQVTIYLDKLIDGKVKPH